METDLFQSIKEKYGDVASFASWSPKISGKAKSGIDDLSIFEPLNTNNVIQTLHTDSVLVGLNISRGDIKCEAWRNFHSPNSKATDYKLRLAVPGTALSGCYMTDVLKGIVEVDSGKVVKDFRDNPQKLKPHLDSLKDELKFISSKRPRLYAFGSIAFKLLIDNLASEYEIIQLYHYASYNISIAKLCEQYQKRSKV